MKEKKITSKSWKCGTYVKTAYSIDGQEIAEELEHKKDWAIEFFNNLPESEEEAIIEDITGNTPCWLDKMIENKIKTKKNENIYDRVSAIVSRMEGTKAMRHLSDEMRCRIEDVLEEDEFIEVFDKLGIKDITDDEKSLVIDLIMHTL